jgi:hypothetical protein
MDTAVRTRQASQVICISYFLAFSRQGARSPCGVYITRRKWYKEVSLHLEKSETG